MSIAGETIDYGPCAFMDTFHPQKVFSSIDEHGRYAWDKQPGIALWNLTRFAECLLPLLAEDQDQAVEIARTELSGFMPAFERHFEDAMRAKLGITEARPHDGDFIARILTHMMNGEADFTLFFRRLTQLAAGASETPLKKLFNDDAIADALLAEWRERTGTAPGIAAMQAANPVRIARNHRVEEAIAAANAGDLAVFQRLVAALQDPFAEDPALEDLELAPLPDEVVARTFCGT